MASCNKAVPKGSQTCKIFDPTDSTINILVCPGAMGVFLSSYRSAEPIYEFWCGHWWWCWYGDWWVWVEAGEELEHCQCRTIVYRTCVPRFSGSGGPRWQPRGNQWGLVAHNRKGSRLWISLVCKPASYMGGMGGGRPGLAYSLLRSRFMSAGIHPRYVIPFSSKIPLPCMQITSGARAAKPPTLCGLATRWAHGLFLRGCRTWIGQGLGFLTTYLYIWFIADMQTL